MLNLFLGLKIVGCHEDGKKKILPKGALYHISSIIEVKIKTTIKHLTSLRWDIYYKEQN